MVDIVYKKKRENGWWGRIKARLSYFPPKRLVLTSLTDFNQFFSLGLTDLHCYELSRLSCSQTKLHKMVEYAGFWNVLGLVSFGGLQWEHRIFVCVLLFLFSFSATLFFFLRKGKKVTGAFELDWPHQRSSGDCEVALAEQPLGRPLLNLCFSLPGGGAGGSAGSRWWGVINMPLLKCGSVIQPVASKFGQHTLSVFIQVSVLLTKTRFRRTLLMLTYDAIH